jgi:signal peptidase I
MLARKWVNVGGFVLLSGIFMVIAGLTVLSYIPLSGFQAQVILSGSMRPALRPGSVIITHSQPRGGYVAGDVVTFRIPDKVRTLVTHRVARAYQTDMGVPVIETKGDANSNGDPWVTSIGAVVGKEVVAIPLIGYALMMVKTQFGFLVFTLIFFVFFVYQEIIWIARVVKHYFPGFKPDLRRDDGGAA